MTAMVTTTKDILQEKVKRQKRTTTMLDGQSRPTTDRLDRLNFDVFLVSPGSSVLLFFSLPYAYKQGKLIRVQKKDVSLLRWSDDGSAGEQTGISFASEDGGSLYRCRPELVASLLSGRGQTHRQNWPWNSLMRFPFESDKSHKQE